MASISITWHTMKDDRVCPICRELEGYTWTFMVGTDSLKGGFLEHPTHGIIWDRVQGSKAHGHEGTCRCEISYVLDINDIVARVNAIHQAVVERIENREGGLSE